MYPSSPVNTTIFRFIGHVDAAYCGKNAEKTDVGLPPPSGDANPNAGSNQQQTAVHNFGNQFFTPRRANGFLQPLAGRGKHSPFCGQQIFGIHRYRPKMDQHSVAAPLSREQVLQHIANCMGVFGDNSRFSNNVPRNTADRGKPGSNSCLEGGNTKQCVFIVLAFLTVIEDSGLTTMAGILPPVAARFLRLARESAPLYPSVRRRIEFANLRPRPCKH